MINLNLEEKNQSQMKDNYNPKNNTNSGGKRPFSATTISSNAHASSQDFRFPNQNVQASQSNQLATAQLRPQGVPKAGSSNSASKDKSSTEKSSSATATALKSGGVALKQPKELDTHAEGIVKSSLKDFITTKIKSDFEDPILETLEKGYSPPSTEKFILKTAFSMIGEKKESEIYEIFDLITSYCKKNEKLKLSIQIPSLKENLSEFLAKLPDLVVDTPKAEDYTIKIISKLIKDDLINVEDLNQLTEKLKQMENEYSEITSELLISKIKNNLTEIKGNDDTPKESELLENIEDNISSNNDVNDIKDEEAQN